MALASELARSRIAGAQLTAICDQPARLRAIDGKLGEQVAEITEYADLLASKPCDAVVIATPHRFHVPQSIQAMEHGLDVFCEKPAGIDVRSVREALAAAKKCARLYMVNFNRRTMPQFQELKRIVDSGRIGRIQRIYWASTNWLRTQSYFDSSSWRGTWAGEGGGVLLNQCPHMLDVLQWVCGMPSRILAHVSFGRHHGIEVEDDVTALLTYPSGAKGVFVASTGEYPGSGRIEIVGERGRVLLEDNRLVCDELETDLPTFIRESKEGFSAPGQRQQKREFEEGPDIVTSLLQNFVDVLRGVAEPVGSGAEAINSLELANAMLLSQWLEKEVALPVDAELYAKLLGERIKSSRLREVKESRVLDLRQSLRI